jgi:hypothetical protein
MSSKDIYPLAEMVKRSQNHWKHFHFIL